MINNEFANKKGEKIYKPLSFYQDRISGIDTGFDSFDEGEQYFFTYNIDNQVVLVSQAYSSGKSRDLGIKSADRNRVLDKRFERDCLVSGHYFFNLMAANHKELATSAWFDSEAARESAIARLSGASLSPLLSSPSLLEGEDTELLENNAKEIVVDKSFFWWALPVLLVVGIWVLFAQCCG